MLFVVAVAVGARLHERRRKALLKNADQLSICNVDDRVDGLMECRSVVVTRPTRRNEASVLITVIFVKQWMEVDGKLNLLKSAELCKESRIAILE